MAAFAAAPLPLPLPLGLETFCLLTAEEDKKGEELLNTDVDVVAALVELLSASVAAAAAALRL